MFSNWLKNRKAVEEAPAPAPAILHLSGSVLDQSLIKLRQGAEEVGGIDQVLDALAVKATFIQSQIGEGAVEYLSEKALYDLAAFMPSVRRRIGQAVAEVGFPLLHGAIRTLTSNLQDTGATDQLMQDFVARFPKDRDHRWVRDLAAEILHYAAPGLYPLACRWVWDEESNTGVLREIWHSDDGVVGRLDIHDGLGTHLVLRDELMGFLLQRGVDSDPEFMVDLLLAQVYAGYIANQGSSYLKAHFSGPSDEFQYTLRMLGLDAAVQKDRRTKVKLADETRHRFQGYVELSAEDGALCQSTKNH